MAITSTAVRKKVNINLLDILPLLKASTARGKEKDTLMERYTTLYNRMITFEECLGYYHTNSSQVGEELKKAFQKKDTFGDLDKIRVEFFRKFNYLPENMKYGHSIEYKYNNYRAIVKNPDQLYKMSQCSLISGADVKSICDKFGFIAMPYECLNEKSFAEENYTKQNQIVNFSEGGDDSNNQPLFDIYVISPVEYYSLNNHVYKNTSEKQIYSGRHSMIFSSVLMNIPMFRTMINTMSKLSNEVSGIKNDLNTVKSNLDQVQATLVNLQRQVDAQQKELVLQKMQIEENKTNMELIAKMQLRILDPVMIAVKAGTDINSSAFDNEACFVGPCWGPDFNENVSMALDMKIIKNQRSMLTKTAQQLWN